MSVNNYCPEYVFFKQIVEPTAKVIFDVGCRFDSIFTNFSGEVHYFDPNSDFLERIKPNLKNTKSYLNNYGLSDKNESLEYYNEQQSFVNRKITHPDTHMNWTKSVFEVKRADEYIQKNNIESIDFLKIDTEGYELKVIKGFGDEIQKIKIIQFEYGGTFIDSGDKLKDVVHYLITYGFNHFHYLKIEGLVPLTNLEDHYEYSNIICFNSKFLIKNM
jgi:FkbM family methyltransferase